MVRICFCPTINFRKKIFCFHVLPSISLEYLIAWTGIRIEWLFFEFAVLLCNREAMEDEENDEDGCS